MFKRAALYDRGMSAANDVKIASAWHEKAAAKRAGTLNYQAMRLGGSKLIPTEYANRILLTK